MSQPQQPRRRRGWGFDEPFREDDPMLPAKNPPPELCLDCDTVHRRDLGCPRPWLLPPWLVTVFGIAFVAVLAVLFCQAVSS